MPTGWAEIEHLDVRWAMPADPEVQEGSSADSRVYGHNALEPDGSLNPFGTYNVTVFRSPADLTFEQLRATVVATMKAIGDQVTEPVPLPSPFVGEEAIFEDDLNETGLVFVRWMVFGDTVVIAFAGGDVDADMDFFFGSFKGS